MKGGKFLRTPKHLSQIVIGFYQSACFDIREKIPDCYLFLLFAYLQTESFKTDGVRNFNFVKMREEQWKARLLKNCNGIRGIGFPHITFHDDPRIDVGFDSQESPRS